MGTTDELAPAPHLGYDRDMSQKALTVAAALLALAAAPLEAQIKPAAPPRARVRGEIIDSVRNRVLTGATVQLSATDNS